METASDDTGERSPGQGTRSALRRAVDQQKALEECPIRTRYNPKDRLGAADAVPVESGRSGGASSRSRRSSASSSALGAAVESLGPSASARSSSSQPPTSKARLLERLGRLASLGGQELRCMRHAVAEAVSHTGNAMDEGAADRVVCELWDLLHSAHDPMVDSVSEDEVRAANVKKKILSRRDDLAQHTKETAYDTLVGRSKFHCGAHDTAIKAAQQKKEAERFSHDLAANVTVEDKVRSFMERDGKRELYLNAQLRKSPIEYHELEELWHSMPGDHAVRRLPESHEAVFDIGDSRISLPRFFAEVLREDERPVEAGQLLEINRDKCGILTLKTHLPRRAVIDTPSRLDAICDVSAIDEMLAFPKAFEEGMKGKSYSHLHDMKRPPDSKMWVEWREMQAKKRVEQLKEREAAIMRMRLANQQRVAAESASGLDVVDVEEVAESMASFTGRSSSKPAQGIVTALPESFPWDARPGPSLAEQERLVRLLLPKELQEARRVRLMASRHGHRRHGQVDGSQPPMEPGKEFSPVVADIPKSHTDKELRKEILEPLSATRMIPGCADLLWSCGFRWGER